MRTVERGGDVQCRVTRGGRQGGKGIGWKRTGEGIIKFRGVKELVTGTQTLHAAWGTEA